MYLAMLLLGSSTTEERKAQAKMSGQHQA